MERKEIEQICCELAVEAGHKIMEVYENEELFADVEYKSDNSPLTKADTAANELIVAGLRKYFPEYAILSEEGKDDLKRLKNPYCFIVDPLDGTKEFIKRNGQFTVNIALAHEHYSVVGVIYVPATQELYYGCQGNGTYHKQMDTGVVTKLTVSDKLTDLTWVGSKSHSSEKEENMIAKHQNVIKDTKSAGSSLKGCMVAKGEADVYYRFGLTCEWDTAAMQCIVEEAGGIFKQMDGSDMTYNREDNLNAKGFFVVNQKENIWV